MSWTPRRQAPRSLRRPSWSDDEGLIQVIACVVVVVGLLLGWRWYRQEQADAEVARAQAQSASLAIATAEAEQRAQRQRLYEAQQAAIAGQSASNAQSTMYRCRDAAGVVAIQNWPCDAQAVTQSSQTYVQPGELREAAESRQRAAAQARHEADVAAYTRMYNGNQAGVAYSALSIPAATVSRCEAAKRYRDGVYRQVGNNRSFDLIRQLDDYVYEACKSN